MAVYVYDENKVDVFVAEDTGSITASATITADYGNITDTADDDRGADNFNPCLLYTSPSPRDQRGSRMPSSA